MKHHAFTSSEDTVILKQIIKKLNRSLKKSSNRSFDELKLKCFESMLFRIRQENSNKNKVVIEESIEHMVGYKPTNYIYSKIGDRIKSTYVFLTHGTKVSIDRKILESKKDLPKYFSKMAQRRKSNEFLVIDDLNSDEIVAYFLDAKHKYYKDAKTKAPNIQKFTYLSSSQIVHIKRSILLDCSKYESKIVTSRVIDLLYRNGMYCYTSYSLDKFESNLNCRLHDIDYIESCERGDIIKNNLSDGDLLFSFVHDDLTLGLYDPKSNTTILVDHRDTINITKKRAPIY